MATAKDIVIGAMKELRLVSSYNAADPLDVKDGLEKLNDIMFGLANDGTTYEHTLMTLTTTFPFADNLIGPAKLWLAKELQGLFGKTLSEQQRRDAEEGETIIFAAYFTVPAAVFDTGLSRLPSNAKYKLND